MKEKLWNEWVVGTIFLVAGGICSEFGWKIMEPKIMEKLNLLEEKD